MPAARKTATLAAKKAAPARKPATAPVEEEVDLLGELDSETTPAATDDEDYDLLAEVSEENGTAWIPADESSESPEGIQGVVTHVGTVMSDAKYGGNEVPYLEIRDKSDEELTWSVRAYHGVLAGQLQKKNPQVGEKIAIKYLGKQSNKKGDQDYYNYGVLVVGTDGKRR